MQVSICPGTLILPTRRASLILMKTQVDYAKEGVITAQVKAVAREEGVDPASLSRQIAEGSAVIMQRGIRYTGIGRGLRTKINVNLGTSTGKADVSEELQKARIAEEFGADTISDLSMGGDINAIRQEIMEHTSSRSPLFRYIRQLSRADLRR